MPLGKPGAKMSMESKSPFDQIYQSDLSAEIRSAFLEQLSFGLDVKDATQTVLLRFGDLLKQPNEGPVVLIVLAALQLEREQLYAPFRDAAIELIESGEAEAAYRVQEPATLKGRKELLSSLANLLQSAQTVDED